MAGGFSESSLAEIKARIDLAELIASYGIQVKRAGASFKACCPFHHEKTPSFNIQPDRGFYHCFGCGESGDAITFVMKNEGLPFADAVRKLAASCGVKLEEEREDPQAGMRKRLYSLLSELASFYHRCLLKASEAEPARKYLASRKLTDDIAERFTIGYAPEGSAAILKWAAKYKYTQEELFAAGVLMKPRYAGDRPYHPFGGRLMFTIRDRSGRAVAFSGRILDAAKSPRKYVNSPETPVFTKSKILFALDQAAPNITKAPGREAIICEGQIDVIRCHSCGFNTAVASQGTAFTEDHVRLLKKVADSVVLVFDADGAGRKAAIRTGREFLAAEMPVRVAELPAGDDPDSLLRDKGPDAFKACLDKAESITRFQARIMREAETNPSSIDAVARVAEGIKETVACCPSAILREALLTDAAELMKMPVAALKEDFERLAARNRAKQQQKELKQPEPPEETQPKPEEDAMQTSIDAAAPVNNPPPRIEIFFCEFIFANEHNQNIAELLKAFAPPKLFVHEFTRKFVGAWLAEIENGDDEIAKLRDHLLPEECKWLDGILLSSERCGACEEDPVIMIKSTLRNLWADAYVRKRGRLEAESNPENDSIRLRITSGLRMLSGERITWERMFPYMKPEMLD